MSAGKTEEQGHGRFPLWLILLWVGFVIWIVTYIVAGFGASPR